MVPKIKQPPASGNDGSDRGAKRQKVADTASAVSGERNLPLLEKKARDALHNHSDTSSSAIANLESRLEAFATASSEEVLKLSNNVKIKEAENGAFQERISKLNKTNKELQSQHSKMTETGRKFAKKYDQVNEQLSTATKDLEDAQGKRQLAEERLVPWSQRLNNLKHIGRRVHEIVIRRVLKVQAITEAYEENERVFRQQNPNSDAHHPDGEGLIAEMGDHTQLLIHGWRSIEGDYVLATQNGQFTE
ncbi:MAG: hypothetical protein M1831_001095 [Alyxoria varia]|nr:MAG: hypothetical protein M1831_001095 [Alyxoria varia]